MGVLVPGRNGGLMNRFQRGESGNPLGRKTLGAYVSEWLNAFSFRKVNRRTLLRIVRSRKADPNMIIAAGRMLAMMDRPDLADFEPLVDGQLSLRELRRQGVDTSQLKRWEPKKTKTTTRKQGEADIEEETTEAKIELFDRAPQAFDAVLDRTDGQPGQSLRISGSIEHVRTIRVIGNLGPAFAAAVARTGVYGGSGATDGDGAAGGAGGGASGDGQDLGGVVEAGDGVRSIPTSPDAAMPGDAGITD